MRKVILNCWLAKNMIEEPGQTRIHFVKPVITRSRFEVTNHKEALDSVPYRTLQSALEPGECKKVIVTIEEDLS